MMNFLEFNKSVEILLDNARPLDVIELYLSDSLGYVLAQDIISSENSPAYPTSAMDGYAIRHQDITNNKIKVIGDNPAGSDNIQEVSSGVCIKTFTGSLMPSGADTLIPIENVTYKDGYIIIDKEVPKGFSVREIGENYQKDQVLIKANTTIGYIEIGIFASLNISHVRVYKKPIVATLSTGSEILDVGWEQTSSSQIRSSNHFVIEAIAKQHGAFVNQFGVIKDNKKEITQAFKKALNSSDIVVSTGGVSVGDYDFVKDIINNELGATLLYKGVAIKPGKHIMVAKKDNKFIIGLPGFAYSSTVTFLIYIVPLIYKMQNSSKVLEIVEAKLTQDFHKRSKLTEFTACNLHYTDNEYRVDFNDKKIGTSAILTNMLGGVALMITTPQDSNKKVGDIVKVLKI